LRMPPLPADSIHARACKLKCEKILTRPHKKPSMIHTVDQFVMKGGKMKKLHFGSKNQNAAFNIV